MKSAPLITSTNAGELGPYLEGRTDLAKYAQGAKLSQGFIHKVQGPAVRSGGLRFIEEIKNSDDRTWLVEFEFSATQAFVLEFGDGYVRFFTDRGRNLVTGVAAYNAITNYVIGDLVSNAGVNYYCILATVANAPPNATYWYALTADIYEIPSPYAVGDLTNSDGTCALRVEQSGDVLYIAHASRALRPYKLTRHGTTNWQFSEYSPNDGPFLSMNQDTASTVYASAQSGSVTLQANGPIFAATDVGRLMRLEVKNLDVKPWETNKSYSVNDLARSDGKTYKALNAKTSGTDTPIHDHGTAFDGQDGVNWEYQEPGYGIARISAYTDADTVTADVIVDRDAGLNVLPFNVVGSGKPTDRWQLGAWSDSTEWPSSVTFFKARLWWSTRFTLHGSVPNDFESMAEDFFNEVRDDCAINYPVSGKQVSEILWIYGADRLMIGTDGGEAVGGEQNANNPLSPSNFQVIWQSRRRVRGVPPEGVGTSLLYVQRAGRKLLSMDFAIDVERYRSSDQNILNDRITRGGITWMCYQGEPDSVLWCGTATGRLINFTLDAEQQVTGWGRRPIGGEGLAECGVTVPSPDGGREDPWFIIKRTINGVTKRYVEVIMPAWEGDDEDGTEGDAQEDAFYLDSGLTYDGAPTTTISGLGHLEGQTVQVLGDGAVVSPNPVVSGAAITGLSRELSKAQIGLPFPTRWVSMRIEVPTQDGTSQGKMKRMHGANVRFVDTLGGRAGQYGKTPERLSLRSVSTPMGSPQAIRSGDFDVSFGADHALDAIIEIVQDQPLPMTIASIAPRMQVHEK